MFTYTLSEKRRHRRKCTYIFQLLGIHTFNTYQKHTHITEGGIKMRFDLFNLLNFLSTCAKDNQIIKEDANIQIQSAICEGNMALRVYLIRRDWKHCRVRSL